MLSNVAIIVRAPDDTVIGWSPGAEQLSGYAADEMLGRSIRALLQSDGEQPWIDGNSERAALVRKRGRRVPVTWTRTPVYDEAGRLIAFTDVLTPVDPDDARPEAGADAELKPSCGSDVAHPPSTCDLEQPDDVSAACRALATIALPEGGARHDQPIESVLRESEHWFRQIVEALPLLTWVSLLDGQCVFTSGRWAEYTGRRGDELAGWLWTSLVHPDDRARLLADWRSAVAHSRDAQFEFRLRRHDGAYRWFEGRATVVRDAQGRSVKWFGYNTDVHEARLAREALGREREHLERIISAAPGAFFSYRKGPDGNDLHAADVACRRTPARPVAGEHQGRDRRARERAPRRSRPRAGQHRRLCKQPASVAQRAPHGHQAARRVLGRRSRDAHRRGRRRDPVVRLLARHQRAQARRGVAAHRAGAADGGARGGRHGHLALGHGARPHGAARLTAAAVRPHRRVRR